MAQSERRQGTRLKTLITAVVTASMGRPARSMQLSATCIDLSVAGMVVTFGRALEPGVTVVATLDMPMHRIDVQATVLRCEPTKKAGRWKVAVKFTHLVAADERRLREYVDTESGKRWE